MNSTLVAFVTSLGIALIITAATLPGRQAPAVINSIGMAGAHLEEAAIGMRA